jgi:hypothetical protein
VDQALIAELMIDRQDVAGLDPLVASPVLDGVAINTGPFCVRARYPGSKASMRHPTNPTKTLKPTRN